MEFQQKNSIPQCYVVVRKLTLEEISRMSINPFFVKHTCGQCKEVMGYGPRCATCPTYYHFDCAQLRRYCCGLKILNSLAMHTPSKCPRCRKSVDYGPQCSICQTRYHSSCVSPFDHCCQLNLFERKKSLYDCGKCLDPVEFGPKCPLCTTIYHMKCIKGVLECCGIQLMDDDRAMYSCRRCRKKLCMGSPMCIFCGKATHRYCLKYRKNKVCCGRAVSLEIFFVPSFQFLNKHYKRFDRRRAMLRDSMESAVYSHTHLLRSSSKKKVLFLTRSSQRTKKKKSVSSQTSTLDNVMIVDVKTELDQKEVDIIDSPPPVLEREDSPEPTSSSTVMPDIIETEDSLKNLFDLLYKTVKKFPLHLQAQVKVDLFKVVMEAEVKCSSSHQNNCF